MALTSRIPAGRRRRARGLNYESRLVVYALASGSVAIIFSLIVLWTGDYTSKVQWTMTLLILGVWFGFAFGVRSLAVRPLQTLANMQSALREGDFSLRARSAGKPDSLSELMYEVNALTDALLEQRVGALEATALLRTIMSEIDVAVLAFDNEQKLRVINRAGERLLGVIAERALGYTAEQLEIADLLEGESARTVERAFPGGSARYSVRRSRFRQGGLPHELVVISDLSRALREEERQAWQRLVRVLGHELNNSLAPIKSIGQSLEEMFHRPTRPADWEDDMSRGLHIITERADALTRFMQDYSRLARLPRPQLRPVQAGPLIRRIVGLEQRVAVQLTPGPDVTINADPDQIEQLLINILRNAVDASLETHGAVHVCWALEDGELVLRVQDEGPGIANPGNLFVPFFTTKQGGSGIGLALSRQIAEGHGGVLSLKNREDARGCEASFTLPLNS